MSRSQYYLGTRLKSLKKILSNSTLCCSQSNSSIASFRGEASTYVETRVRVQLVAGLLLFREACVGGYTIGPAGYR